MQILITLILMLKNDFSLKQTASLGGFALKYKPQIASISAEEKLLF